MDDGHQLSATQPITGSGTDGGDGGGDATGRWSRPATFAGRRGASGGGGGDAGDGGIGACGAQATRTGAELDEENKNAAPTAADRSHARRAHESTEWTSDHDLDPLKDPDGACPVTEANAAAVVIAARRAAAGDEGEEWQEETPDEEEEWEEQGLHDYSAMAFDANDLVHGVGADDDINAVHVELGEGGGVDDATGKLVPTRRMTGEERAGTLDPKP